MHSEITSEKWNNDSNIKDKSYSNLQNTILQAEEQSLAS